MYFFTLAAKRLELLFQLELHLQKVVACVCDSLAWGDMPTLGLNILVAHAVDHHTSQTHNILWLRQDILDQKMKVQETSSSLGVHMDLVSFYHGYCKSSPHQYLVEGGTCGSLKGVGPPSGTWHFDLPEHMKTDLTVEHAVAVEGMVCYGT